ncbi:hypothetical protein NEOLEDRAFT_1141182 [Neolentinus lepideus HHB14362 ss-1]|uniref:Transcription factor BYE1 n=1 Tax=Neolentinus lepideus HHB14362 ss-1 TaxID=1314782 RepID=A0A165NTT3_9AGAM|nr:hypothetical protein NEOLEDRAFT_1141182 [Neolentinus lepideus HHB14362 ss-1]
MPARSAQRSDAPTLTKKGRASAHKDETDTEKENAKVVKGKGRKKAARGKSKKVYCMCKGPDDGTPMVACGECEEWYHFRCVNLDESDADDLLAYICPSCQEQTGRRSVMEWEGPDALEEVEDEAPPVVQPKKRSTPARHREEESEPQKDVSDKEVSELESDGSSDDYVEEAERPRSKGNPKRRPVRISSDSESDDEADPGHSHRRASTTPQTANRSKKSPSPYPSSHLKRKGSSAVQSPAPKRKRSESSGSVEDPARKYCLGKFEELFVPIFTRFPHLSSDLEGDISGGVAEMSLREPTAEEKALLESRAKQFAAELEHCIFDTYAEPGQHGKQVAGAKYKERFRMLTFNLSKSDRITLHKNIASSRITPKELSLMSSTDLANEELKQSIKIAEQEALEHSILQKTAAPRAKITHKGLQDIEDVHGEIASQRLERERELEEEKRERERLARLKASQQHHARGSVPPESPITPQSASWGGPPPVPQHALHGDLVASFGSMRPPPNPLFVPTPSEMMNTPVPNELNLADLINLDEETPTPTNEPPVMLSEASPPSPSNEAKASGQSEPQASPVHLTGISPFAAGVTPSDPPRSSFDLNALWTSPDQPKHETPEHGTPPPEPQDDRKDVLMETSEGPGADDEDFDMFLEKDDERSNDNSHAETSAPQDCPIEKLPQVYTGALSMPLDTLVPQETPVVAYQMGGRAIAPDSPLWRTLFPSAQLRIDGRVPVDKSSQFLLQMRMNATKELIAVAFAPVAGTDQLFRNLFDFLKNKNRHGLVFPWGNHPKEYYPGRELYIIPLSSAEPIPEYMELLDGLHLPKSRASDYLAGIWVLNKGKLAPPPTPNPAPQASVAPLNPAIPQPLPTNGTPLNNVATPVPVPAPLTPITSVPQNPPAPAAINPQAVAAELATLTPEQIQLMLQTLSGSGLVPPVSIPTGVPPIPLQPPGMTAQTPPWPISPPGAGFASRFPQNLSPNSQSRPSYSQPPHDRYSERDRERRGASSWDNGDRVRDDRGWRGGGRAHGRGRGGRGRGRDRDHDRYGKSQDSGWGRRGRGGPQ